METKDNVYNNFLKFCKEHNLPMTSKTAFSQQLKKLIPCTDTHTTINGQTIRVWRDIQRMSAIQEIVEFSAKKEEKQAQGWLGNVEKVAEMPSPHVKVDLHYCTTFPCPSDIEKKK